MLAPSPRFGSTRVPVITAAITGALVLALAACSGGGGGPGSGSGGRVGSGGGSGTGGAVGTGGQGGSVGAGTGGGGASSGGSGGGATASGGAGASGGASGMAGQAGNVGTGGGATAGASGVRPFFTEDFEAGMVGRQPAGWDNFIAYQKNNPMNPDGSGTLALVDATRAHGGVNSVHFHGGGSPAMITRPLPVGTTKLYVRGYFYLTRQLGMTPTTANPNHETLIGIRKSSGSANDEVRFGEIKGVIGTNEFPSDNIAPKTDQWNKGPVIAANRWACIEVAFIADQPQHALYAWADGVLVHSVTSPADWQNAPPLPMNWMNGKFVEVILGWHSFSNATIDVWMDDLALSTERIGCN